MSDPIRYSLGFAFDPLFHNVLLIEKKRPSWQAGKFNGIGGVIEKEESPAMGMAREFKEETGLNIGIHHEDWSLFAMMSSENEALRPWKVYCFHLVMPLEYFQYLTATFKTCVDDEKLAVFNPAFCVDPSASDQFVDGVQWLVSLAILNLKSKPRRMWTIQECDDAEVIWHREQEDDLV